MLTLLQLSPLERLTSYTAEATCRHDMWLGAQYPATWFSQKSVYLLLLSLPLRNSPTIVPDDLETSSISFPDAGHDTYTIWLMNSLIVLDSVLQLQ